MLCDVCVEWMWLAFVSGPLNHQTTPNHFVSLLFHTKKGKRKVQGVP